MPDDALRVFDINLRQSWYTAEVIVESLQRANVLKINDEELEAEVKRLRSELEWAQLQNKALNTLIDIAESRGIQIRKKSGAKQ